MNVKSPAKSFAGLFVFSEATVALSRERALVQCPFLGRVWDAELMPHYRRPW